MSLKHFSCHSEQGEEFQVTLSFRESRGITSNPVIPSVVEESPV